MFMIWNNAQCIVLVGVGMGEETVKENSSYTLSEVLFSMMLVTGHPLRSKNTT